MAWFQDRREPGFFNSLCFKVLKCGQVPQHVAFIMDGNRRFAEKLNVGRQIGHSRGFEKLAEVLYWCFQLGIPEVTVYAFSTENFKRSEDEVNGLMKLAKEKFEKLLEEKESVMKYGVSVRVIGDISLIPEDVRISIANAVEFSKDNTRSILNVAIAYASRHEITEAIKEIAIGVEEGVLKESDISETLIEKSLYTNKCRELDLVIRTSGEIRLSDFLMWQSSYSMLSFVDELWPEFSIWQFFKCILSYQLRCKTINEKRLKHKTRLEESQLAEDMNIARDRLSNNLENEGNSNPELKFSQKSLCEELKRYRTEQNKRIQQFLENLDVKRNSILNKR